jgi:hypothetical protein
VFGCVGARFRLAARYSRPPKTLSDGKRISHSGHSWFAGDTAITVDYRSLLQRAASTIAGHADGPGPGEGV